MLKHKNALAVTSEGLLFYVALFILGAHPDWASRIYCGWVGGELAISSARILSSSSISFFFASRTAGCSL